MPAESGPQYRLMAGIANGMKPRGKNAPSVSVAKDFVDATPSSKRSEWAKKKTGFHGVTR
jgi:hypothetical protein